MILAYSGGADKVGSPQSSLDKLSDPIDDLVAGVAVIIAGWALVTRATAWWRKNNSSGHGLQLTWHRLETVARAALDQWRTYEPPPSTPTE